MVLGALAVAAASQAALFDRDSQGDWIEGADVALATVAVATFVVFGVLTHRTGFGAFGRWMELGYRLEASRFARSAIALIVAVVGGARSTSPCGCPIRFSRPTAAEIQGALDLHARIGGSSTPLMAANGDKAIFTDGERGLCLYRIAGPYLVVFSDPVVRAGRPRGVPRCALPLRGRARSPSAVLPGLARLDSAAARPWLHLLQARRRGAACRCGA